jgi:acetyl-CoA C-acetyltransferase
MTTITDNTPVLVGIGVIGQKLDDWEQAKEASELMCDAALAALEDAGCAGEGGGVERIYVPRGLWHYGDPARLVGDAIGAAGATSILVEIGVMQQTAVGDACRQIAEGAADMTLVVGGEARYRGLRAQIAGTEAPETEQKQAPDITMTPTAELYLDAELNSGLGYMPVNYYAIMESAFRAAHGWSLDHNRDRLAAMYSRFSEIATDNPHAWKPGSVAAETIRDPSPKNPMLAFPYTKLHNTSWNVDQAGALLFCSAKRAAELGIPRQRWLFPLVSAECSHMLSVAQRRELHRVPGVKAAGALMLEQAGCGPQDLDLLELYSCFPIAVESYAAEMGIDLQRDLTVTGGMPFAGGPLNNYVIQSTCRMAELLRDGRGKTGLVSCVSGLMTKQGLGLWSTEPGSSGFEVIDVTEAVAADNPPMEVVDDFSGDATIAGYTVMYQLGEPHRAVAMVNTDDGKRAVVWSEEADLMAAMEQQEYCGRRVSCAEDQITAVHAPA